MNHEQPSLDMSKRPSHQLKQLMSRDPSITHIVSPLMNTGEIDNVHINNSMIRNQYVRGQASPQIQDQHSRQYDSLMMYRRNSSKPNMTGKTNAENKRFMQLAAGTIAHLNQHRPSKESDLRTADEQTFYMTHV